MTCSQNKIEKYASKIKMNNAVSINGKNADRKKDFKTKDNLPASRLESTQRVLNQLNFIMFAVKVDILLLQFKK